LFDNASLVNNGLVIFDCTGGATLVNTSVTGAGNFIFHKGFTELAFYNDNYTGWVQIDPGATFQPSYGNTAGVAGPFGVSAITNNGTLFMTRQDAIVPTSAGGPPVVFSIPANIVGSGRVVKENNNQNAGGIGLVGTNTYTGDSFIAGGGIYLGDNATVGGGQIVGTVYFTNTTTTFDNPRVLVFYRPDNFIFTNNIIGAVTVSAGGNFGTIEQSGTGAVTITGNNTYVSGTIIDATTTLQVGAGGTNGNLGGGAVTDNGTLVFDLSKTLVFTNAIGETSGDLGALVQIGSGTLKLTGANTYTGATTISNGSLVVTAVGGDMDVYGGILNPGGDPTVNTLTVAGNLNMNAGTIVAYVNEALSPPNTTIAVTGSIDITGGTLKLVNIGATGLAVGDVFNIFGSTPTITSLSGLTIVSPGFAAIYNGNGSFKVTSVAAPGSDVITAAVAAGQLNLSWPSVWTGMLLQIQTNPDSIGISTNWVTIAGTDSGNTYSAPLSRSGCVFYRLAPQ
jgi:autotransporter-associated beta strand protein